MLPLWGMVVIEVFENDEVLTLGRAAAGLNPYTKGVSLGLFLPIPIRGMDNPYAFFSLILPRISSIIFPCSRQMDRRMVSIGQG